MDDFGLYSIECDSIWSYDDRTVTSACGGEILH